MGLNQFLEVFTDEDGFATVICSLEHIINYMNHKACVQYEKYDEPA